MKNNSKDKEEKQRDPFTEALRLFLYARHFHDDKGYVYVEVEWANHPEIFNIDSSIFVDRFMQQYYNACSKPLSKQTCEQVRAQLKAKARTGPPQDVFVRLGSDKQSIYHFLADDEYDVVKITSSSYEVTTKPTINFIRTRGAHQLPLSQPSDKTLITLLSELYPFISIELITLIACWLVGAMQPKGPYPILGIFGPKGSGKSTISRQILSFLDPQTACLSSEPTDISNLSLLAHNSYIVALDNLSTIPIWLSDALCRISTGGGNRKRKLFTDTDEVLFELQRPIILNGITNVITRDDLRDRSVSIELPAIPPSQRQTEEDLNRRYEALRPQILDAIYRCVSTALRRRHSITLAEMPRMADFFKWVTAAEPAMGCDAGAIEAVLSRNRKEGVYAVLDSDPIAAFVIAIARERKTITVTASKLLDSIRLRMEESSYFRPKMPITSPQRLSQNLIRIEPALREVGVMITRSRQAGGARERLITITLVENADGA